VVVAPAPVWSPGPAVVATAHRRPLSRLWAPVATRVYLPACLVVVAAALLVGIGWSTGWGGADYGGSVRLLRIVVLGPVSLGIIGLILIVERVRPAQRRALVARGHRQDALYTILNVTLIVPLMTALTLSFVEVTRRVFPWIVLPPLGIVPRSVVIAVIFVCMDGLNWYVHLANHRVRVLWRFHELHHSQEDLNALTVFRTHPFLHVSYLVALIPGVVLLANGAVSTSVLIAYAAFVAFAHSNTNLGFGPLRRVFVSPNYHRIHHRRDGAQDVNLGFALTIWDQLSRRAVFPDASTIRIDTGLEGRPLAVEQAGPRPRHLQALGAQLIGPFRPMDRPVDLPSVRETQSARGSAWRQAR
jgi:sterol desaturase/sphingolipid hydroxylase (fatty acid hydroxylase superfamily)